jgi:hypothetical protein
VTACSPDVTPLDLFLWRRVVGCVCRYSVGDISTLPVKMFEGIRKMAKGMLTRMWAELVCWPDEIRTTNGSPLEVD